MINWDDELENLWEEYHSREKKEKKETEESSVLLLLDYKRVGTRWRSFRAFLGLAVHCLFWKEDLMIIKFYDKYQ